MIDHVIHPSPTALNHHTSGAPSPSPLVASDVEWREGLELWLPTHGPLGFESGYDLQRRWRALANRIGHLRESRNRLVAADEGLRRRLVEGGPVGDGAFLPAEADELRASRAAFGIEILRIRELIEEAELERDSLQREARGFVRVQTLPARLTASAVQL